MIWIKGASAPTTDSNGDAWDVLGGAPDLKACVFVNDSTTPVGCTPERSDVFSATWTTGNSFAVTITSTTKVTVRLYDVDATVDDFIEGFSWSDGAAFLGYARTYGFTGKANSSQQVTWDILIGAE